jgi:hypothetical protein
MLTSQQPIWIGWGKELIYLYDDPHKSIIGGKRPWALGRPTAQVWSEIWDDIAPPSRGRSRASMVHCLPHADERTPERGKDGACQDEMGVLAKQAAVTTHFDADRADLMMARRIEQSRQNK